MSRARLLIILALAAVVMVGSFYVYGEKTSVPDSVKVEKQPVNAAVAIEKSTEDVVYVSGAVIKPGVVKLPAGSRVQDAVNAVGGIMADADAANINLAEKVKDGMHVHVPSIVQNGQGGALASHTTVVQQGGKVNINRADKNELDKLPGIGPAMAERIVQYRETNGAFTTVDDLKKVQGIGEAKFNKLKDKITI